MSLTAGQRGTRTIARGTVKIQVQIDTQPRSEVQEHRTRVGVQAGRTPQAGQQQARVKHRKTNIAGQGVGKAGTSLRPLGNLFISYFSLNRPFGTSASAVHVCAHSDFQYIYVPSIHRRNQPVARYVASSKFLGYNKSIANWHKIANIFWPPSWLKHVS